MHCARPDTARLTLPAARPYAYKRLRARAARDPTGTGAPRPRSGVMDAGPGQTVRPASAAPVESQNHESTGPQLAGWEVGQMDIVPVVVAAVVALAGGAVLGFLARGVWASQSIKDAEGKAALIVEKATTRQKELILQAKDEKLRLAAEVEEEARGRRQELNNLERRLLQRDEQIDQRADMLE